jgi:hypothetical protein
MGKILSEAKRAKISPGKFKRRGAFILFDKAYKPYGRISRLIRLVAWFN